ncbi:carboxymuconolactone decarboxylase family protein [Gordonia sinesedis]
MNEADDRSGQADAQSARRRRGLDMMSQVYGWTAADGPGDYFAHTADHLFGEVWTRDGLSIRDRRLLLFGALAASGQIDVAEIQASAALTNAELTPEQLEEISLFLCYYVGWPAGTKLHFMFGDAIAKYRKAHSGGTDE